MRRFAVIGALILVVAVLAGPAFAQTEQGSSLPPPGPSQMLPQAQVQSAAQQGEALADTGLEMSRTALLGVVLLAIGGSALLLGRSRRADRS